jgi:hypothetical protein
MAPSERISSHRLAADVTVFLASAFVSQFDPADLRLLLQ